jgi:hypothetical protein
MTLASGSRLGAYEFIALVGTMSDGVVRLKPDTTGDDLTAGR